jgi:hypothetical protein
VCAKIKKKERNAGLWRQKIKKKRQKSENNRVRWCTNPDFCLTFAPAFRMGRWQDAEFPVMPLQDRQQQFNPFEQWQI